MDLRIFHVSFVLIIAKAVASQLDRHGIACRSKKNVNYHNILLSAVVKMIKLGLQ